MHKVQIETATVRGRQTPALVVRESRLKMLLVLLGSLMFVVLPIFLLWSEFGGGSPKSTPRSRTGAIIAGLVGIPFGIVGASIALMRMRSPEGVLVLTPFGVEFPYLASREFISWDSIHQVEVWSMPNGDAIGFVLTDSGGDASVVRRLIRNANQDIAGFDFAISIGKQARPLRELIAFYLNHPSARCELGTPACLERYRNYLAAR